MSDDIIVYNLSKPDEELAELMVVYRGNLNKVSRDSACPLSVQKLRRHIQATPDIRGRYQQLLTESLQEAGLHISERILKMTDMQEEAYGDIDNDIPADPKLVIEISKHISDLIKESRGLNVDATSAVLLTSKESVQGLLEQFLKS